MLWPFLLISKEKEIDVPMRKLILEVQLSVDGFLADSSGKTDWMQWNWGPEWTWDKALQDYHTALTQSVDCILLSRQMAEEGFIAHWARAAENTMSPQYAFAKHVSEINKVVFTKTLSKVDSIPGGENKTAIAYGDYVDSITTLKKQNGKDILVYGGAAFAGSLLKAKLIDEMHLIINPIVLGKGLSFFNQLENKQNLGLIKVNSFSDGMVVLHYKINKN
jgi:dihydrofolate reductase